MSQKWTSPTTTPDPRAAYTDRPWTSSTPDPRAAYVGRPKPPPAVPDGPIDRDPTYGTSLLELREREVLLHTELADVELGAYDGRVVEWLAGQDQDVVLVIASWVRRARAAGKLTEQRAWAAGEGRR